MNLSSLQFQNSMNIRNFQLLGYIFSILLALAGAFTPSFAQELLPDAIDITLKRQTGIPLNLDIARGIDSSLRAIGAANFRSLRASRINFYQAIIRVRDSNAVKSWFQGNPLSGNRFIDSILQPLGVTSATRTATQGSFATEIVLRFRIPANIPALQQELVKSSIVSAVYTSLTVGDGNSITYFTCKNEEYFVLIYGSGDCPAGCTSYSYKYFRVEKRNGDRIVKDDGGLGWGDNFSGCDGFGTPCPTTFIYDVPQWGDNYSITQFGTAQKLIQSLRDSLWWVQKHAIEATWRVIKFNKPTGLDTRADSSRIRVWNTIQRELLSRREEIISVLRSIRNTDACFVAPSVDTALKELSMSSVKEEETPLFLKVYPNPAQSLIKCKLPASDRMGEIEIVNSLGTVVKRIKNSEVSIAGTTLEISTTDLENGIYVLRYCVNGKNLIAKFVIFH